MEAFKDNQVSGNRIDLFIVILFVCFSETRFLLCSPGCPKGVWLPSPHPRPWLIYLLFKNPVKELLKVIHRT